MNNKKQAIIMGLLVIISSYLSASTSNELNEEAQAFQQCQHYNQAILSSHPNEIAIDCKLMNYSAEEWVCFENKRMQTKIPKQRALTQCFHSAPALVGLKAQTNLKRSAVCTTAFSSFAKFYPGDDRLMLLAKQCPKTTKTPLQWLCMNKFAEAGNSYNYAAGQCLPRKKITM